MTDDQRIEAARAIARHLNTLSIAHEYDTAKRRYMYVVSRRGQGVAARMSSPTELLRFMRKQLPAGAKVVVREGASEQQNPRPRSRRNPVSVMRESGRAQRLAAAESLFRRFTGHKGEVLGKMAFPKNPKQALAIGELFDVGYVTVRDGKVERYRHTFPARSRPLLVVSFDGTQLFILGGGYRFTDRGIVG